MRTNAPEQIREDLQLSVDAFCTRLGVAPEDYAVFIAADDLSNFPPRAMTRLCPSNCKLAETNRTLEEMFGAPPMHENFIG